MTPPDIISTKPSPELASIFEMHILDATEVLVGEPVPSADQGQAFAEHATDRGAVSQPNKSPKLPRSVRPVFPIRLASGFDMRLLAVLALGTLVLAPLSEPASAQEAAPQQRVVKKRNFAVLCQKESFAKGNPKTCARFVKKEAEPKQPEQPSRPDFTADDQAAGGHSGHSGRALLGRFRKGLPRSAPGNAGSLACVVDRRRRRRVRRRPAQRMVGVRASGRSFPSSPA